MKHASIEEQMVMLTLNSVEALLDAVKNDPLAYEDHLSAVTDIMLKAGEAKRAISLAIAQDQMNDSLDITTNARLKIAGWI